jgi:hypothetical protein
MYNTQYPLLLNQRNGDDAPQDYEPKFVKTSELIQQLKLEEPTTRTHAHTHTQILAAP